MHRTEIHSGPRSVAAFYERIEVAVLNNRLAKALDERLIAEEIAEIDVRYLRIRDLAAGPVSEILERHRDPSGLPTDL